MTRLHAIVRRALIAIPAALLVSLVSSAWAGAVEVERVVSKGGIEAWFVHDTSVPLISVEFLFRGGAALDPKGKTGLANLTASLLDEGAGDLDSQAFQTRLDDHAIELRFSADRDFFHVNVRTLTEHRDEALRLLTLAMTRPRFDAEPMEQLGPAFADPLEELDRVVESKGHRWTAVRHPRQRRSIPPRSAVDRRPRGRPDPHPGRGTGSGHRDLAAERRPPRLGPSHRAW